jgi:hypothetical protein
MALGELSTPGWLNPQPGWLESKSSSVGSFMQGYLGGKEAGKERTAQKEAQKQFDAPTGDFSTPEEKEFQLPGEEVSRAPGYMRNPGEQQPIKPFSDSWLSSLVRGATGIAGGVGGYWNPNIREQETAMMERPLRENLIKSQIVANDAKMVAANSKAALGVAEAADAATAAAMAAKMARAESLTPEGRKAIEEEFLKPGTFQTAKGYIAAREMFEKSIGTQMTKDMISEFRKQVMELGTFGLEIWQKWDGSSVPPPEIKELLAKQQSLFANDKAKREAQAAADKARAEIGPAVERARQLGPIQAQNAADTAARVGFATMPGKVALSKQESEIRVKEAVEKARLLSEQMSKDSTKPVTARPVVKEDGTPIPGMFVVISPSGGAQYFDENKKELTPSQAASLQLRNLRDDMKALQAQLEASQKELRFADKEEKPALEAEIKGIKQSLSELRKERDKISTAKERGEAPALKAMPEPKAEEKPKAASERRVSVVSPDGVGGTIPESQLEQALKNGYRRAD